MTVCVFPGMFAPKIHELVFLNRLFSQRSLHSCVHFCSDSGKASITGPGGDGLVAPFVASPLRCAEAVLPLKDSSALEIRSLMNSTCVSMVGGRFVNGLFGPVSMKRFGKPG